MSILAIRIHDISDVPAKILVMKAEDIPLYEGMKKIVARAVMITGETVNAGTMVGEPIKEDEYNEL